MRLFDDIPMLKHILDAGQKNEDTLETWLVTVNNILDQIYYPIEHLVSDDINISSL